MKLFYTLLHFTEFTPKNRFKSIRTIWFAYTCHMAVTQEVGGSARCMACSLAKYGCPTAQCPHWWRALVCRDRDCRVSCGNPSIGGLADSRQQPVHWFGRSDFLGNQIDSLSESNHESECSTAGSCGILNRKQRSPRDVNFLGKHGSHASCIVRPLSSHTHHMPW